MKIVSKTGLVAVGALTLVGISSCVDQTYDLSKDNIDLTMQVGGNMLSIPASSTQFISLADVLDLSKDDDSAIKEISESNIDKYSKYGLSLGDYVLTQDGSIEESKIDVPTIAIDNVGGISAQTGALEFYNLPSGAQFTVETGKITNKITLKQDNVDKQVKKVESADISVPLELEIGYETFDNFLCDIIINEGFYASFPKGWSLEITDDATKAYMEIVDGHKLTVKTDMLLRQNVPFVAKLKLYHIEFAEGEGLVSPGTFKLESNVESQGNLTLAGKADILQLGTTAKIVFKTNVQPQKAQITKVVGVISPEINIDGTSFELNDIPDFLSNGENNLDIYNPQIMLDVTNTSPLTVNLSAMLIAKIKGEESGVCPLGQDKPVVVKPGKNTIVVCRQTPVNPAPNTQYVVAPINNLIQRIPDAIYFEEIKANAVEEPLEYTLGTTYAFGVNYDVVVPLAFGENMTVHYDNDTNFDESDTEDLDKFNFGQIELSFDVVSSIPLGLAIDVKALGEDANGEKIEIDDVLPTIEGSVAPGSVAAPSTSHVSILLVSQGKNLGKLRGVRLIFDAKSNAETAGVVVNSAQGLSLDNVLVKILGGVTVDLNDILE